jgi:hypothetical protein
METSVAWREKLWSNLSGMSLSVDMYGPRGGNASAEMAKHYFASRSRSTG